MWQRFFILLLFAGCHIKRKHEFFKAVCHFFSLIQIEIDQIFALNPTLVVQPKPKPTPSNKRISTTPSNKVGMEKVFLCYIILIMLFMGENTFLSFLECKEWKSQCSFTQSPSTIRLLFVLKFSNNWCNNVSERVMIPSMSCYSVKTCSYPSKDFHFLHWAEVEIRDKVAKCQHTDASIW